MTDFHVRISMTHLATVIFMHQADNSPTDTDRFIEDRGDLLRYDLLAPILSYRESGSVGGRCT